MTMGKNNRSSLRLESMPEGGKFSYAFSKKVIFPVSMMQNSDVQDRGGDWKGAERGERIISLGLYSYNVFFLFLLHCFRDYI